MGDRRREKKSDNINMKTIVRCERLARIVNVSTVTSLTLAIAEEKVVVRYRLKC
jgi:hypothetical protein